MKFLAIFSRTRHLFWLKSHKQIVLIIVYNFSIDTMAGKNHLHRFFSHFRLIFSKIMRFSNPVISELGDIHGVGPMSKQSISGTLSPKCNQFPWKFFNFEILALKSDRYVSPQI